MGVDEFLEYLKRTGVLTDCIVRLQVKYFDEEGYRYINELFEYDGDHNLFITSDWHHCAEYAEVVGYIPVDEITEFRRI